MAADLIARARAGDGEAFRELTKRYRRELQVHCYRMLGSVQDSEDAVQDTLLAAWQGIGGFEERSSLRTWLYRIATNRCAVSIARASIYSEFFLGFLARARPSGQLRLPAADGRIPLVSRIRNCFIGGPFCPVPGLEVRTGVCWLGGG